MAHHVTESAQLHAASVASYSASALNVVFGLTINEWCMVIGTACALGTFGINWWYRHQESVRADRRDANRRPPAL